MFLYHAGSGMSRGCLGRCVVSQALHFGTSTLKLSTMLAAARTSRLHATGGGLHLTAHAHLNLPVTTRATAASARLINHQQLWQPTGLQLCVPRAPIQVSRQSRQVQVQGVAFEGGIPEGVQVEVKGPQESSDIDWDASTKTLRLPYNVIEASGERRTKLVIFTCNKCGGRTARNVNPIAWEKGLVMGQCAHCQVWHVLSAKNPLIYEEIRYKDDPRFSDSTASSSSSSSVGSDSADASMPEISSESAVSSSTQQPDTDH